MNQTFEKGPANLQSPLKPKPVDGEGGQRQKGNREGERERYGEGRRGRDIIICE